MGSQPRAVQPLARRLLLATFLAAVFLPASVGALNPTTPCPAVTPSSTLTTPLIRAGLDAEALAAAGVTGSEVAGLVTAVTAAVGSGTQTLSQADAAHAAARGNRDTLERKVKSGLASDADVIALQAAEATLTAAVTARTAALDEIFDAGTAGLSPAKTAALLAIQQNRSWAVPIQYMVNARTEAQWVALVDAVANKQIAAQLGEAPAASCTALLAQVDAESAVAAAKVNSGANLAAVQAAWNAALAE